MEEYDDQGIQPPAEQPQPEGPPEVPSFTSIAAGAPTWTSSDDVRYARKAASLGQLQDDIDQGFLYPHHAAEAAGPLVASLAEMNQRKQAADARQQQTATQAALAQNAAQRAVEQADMQHRAAGFQATMHMFVDPTNGESTAFYQKRPGEWEPVPQKDKSGPEDYVPAPASGEGGVEGGATPGAAEGAGQGSGEGGPLPLGPDGRPLTDQPRHRTVTGDDGVARQQRIPTLAEHQAMRDATPQQQVGIAGQIARGTFGQAAGPPAAGGPLSIQNGPYTDQYQGGQLTGTDRPPAPQPEASPAGSHYEEAKKILGQPPPPFIRGAHGQTIPNPQYVAYQRAATAMALDMWKTDRQHAQHAEHQRQEQSRADAKAKATDSNDHADRWLKSKNAHLKTLVSDWQAGNAGEDGKKKPVPEDVHKELEGRAKDMADQDHVDAYGEDRLPASRKKQRALDSRAAGVAAAPIESPGGAAAAPEPAAAAPKVEPLPPEKATLADVQAEIERRKAAREGPGLWSRVFGGGGRRYVK
jgi:hypothetical protein